MIQRFRIQIIHSHLEALGKAWRRRRQPTALHHIEDWPTYIIWIGLSCGLTSLWLFKQPTWGDSILELKKAQDNLTDFSWRRSAKLHRSAAGRWKTLGVPVVIYCPIGGDNLPSPVPAPLCNHLSYRDLPYIVEVGSQIFRHDYKISMSIIIGP